MPSTVGFSDSSARTLSLPEPHSADTQYLLHENEVEMWGKQFHGENKETNTQLLSASCVPGRDLVKNRSPS